MQNRIKVVVADRIFHLTTSDNEEYVRKVASYVDDQVKQLSEASNASTLDAGIMAALDIADSYFKEQAASENLRRQVKEYADEAARLKAELNRSRAQQARPAPQPEPEPEPETQPEPEEVLPEPEEQPAPQPEPPRQEPPRQEPQGRRHKGRR